MAQPQPTGKDLMNVVGAFFMATSHVIFLLLLLFGAVTSHVTVGVCSFVFMVATGFFLSMMLVSSWSARWFCRPLAGCLAATAWWGVFLFYTAFLPSSDASTGGTGSTGADGSSSGSSLGVAAFCGMIAYWIGFAVEWRDGYCYHFAETATRHLHADKEGLPI